MKAPKLWTVFSDAAGLTYSFARLSCAVLLAASITWGSFIVFKEHKIPDFTTVALLFGAIYGVNRIGEAFGTKPVPPEQPS